MTLDTCQGVGRTDCRVGIVVVQEAPVKLDAPFIFPFAAMAWRTSVAEGGGIPPPKGIIALRFASSCSCIERVHRCPDLGCVGFPSV